MLTEEQTWPPILSLVVVYGRIEGEVASGKVHSPCRRMRMMAREALKHWLSLRLLPCQILKESCLMHSTLGEKRRLGNGGKGHYLGLFVQVSAGQLMVESTVLLGSTVVVCMSQCLLCTW